MLNRLREVREQKWLTQEALSELSGVTRASISQIEAGHRPPRFGTALKLAAALGVSPDELTDRSEPPAAPVLQRGRGAA